MQTVVWNMQHVINDDELTTAAEHIRSGKQVAFPTETVYGLGADATNTEAVAGIFAAKGRPSDNPLIVHIAHKAQLEPIVTISYDLERQLMTAFWPGPFTLILQAKPNTLATNVTAGLNTVGIRMPDHPIALALIAKSEKPIAAPSANRSGRPSPTQASHVYEDLQQKIVGIIDGGATGVGLESTVAVVEDEHHIRILRPGGVTKEMLQAAFPHVMLTVETDSEQQEAPRSPGMKYTHYAPKGKLTVVVGEQLKVVGYINSQMAEYADKSKVGVLTFDEHYSLYDQAAHIISLGKQSRLEDASRHLYDALRQFDAQGVEVIWSEATTRDGLGYAFMNRLVKAAGYSIIEIN